MMLRLEKFEQRLDNGTPTEFDQKVYGALSNHVRLGLRELGLKPPPEKKASLAEVLGRHQIASP
ncbi:MAG TPA: hypothetical protein VFE63_10000 [Roseiarcus sp.]|jgi:hypothetical protein|nr:hypothetical protein [Roseiarcus sp.]